MDHNAQLADQPVSPVPDAPAAHLTVAPIAPIEQNAWIDTRTIRGVTRTALLNRIEAFGAREVQQRSSQEIAFILLAIAVAALVAGPALVPLVVALRGGQL